MRKGKNEEDCGWKKSVGRGSKRSEVEEDQVRKRPEVLRRLKMEEE